MLESIQRMFDALHDRGIQYCHWKSNEHLEPALNGDTDLDMLFRSSDRSKLDILLNECGLKRFRATHLSQYNAIEDYIGFDKNEAKIWHLHLHYRLTIGENHLKGYTLGRWGDYILRNRVLHELGVYTSCPEDELVLLFTRIALKYSLHSAVAILSEDDNIEMKWLKDRINKDEFLKHAEWLVGPTCGQMIVSMLKEGVKYKRDFYKLEKQLKKELRCFTGNNAFESFINREIRTVYWVIGGINHRLHGNASKPYSRVSPSGGCVIAFIGSDGAGKSTTIKYVREELSKKLDIKEVYLGSGDGSSSILRKPMKMIAKRVGGKGLGASVDQEYENAESEKKGVSIKARLYTISKFIWAVTLASEKKSKMKEITKARNNGMIVLLDRYPQCRFYGVNDGPLLYKYIDSKSAFLRHNAENEYKIYEMFEKNPPDLTIKLIAPIEIAMRRKPEMTREELDKKLEAVMTMQPSDQVIIVDTSVEMKQSFGEVMNAIWEII